jgi:hypothetical protein
VANAPTPGMINFVAAEISPASAEMIDSDPAFFNIFFMDVGLPTP